MALKTYRYTYKVQGTGLTYSGDLKVVSRKQAMNLAQVKLFSQTKREVPEQLIELEEVK